MGYHVVQFLSSVTASASHPSTSPLLNPLLPQYEYSRFSNNHDDTPRCWSTRYVGRSAGPRWDSNAEKSIRTERFRFNTEDEFLADDDDDDEDQGFGFTSSAKKRIWWSDDYSDDDDGEDEFGVWEGSIGIPSIFKVFRAVGWMLPAIAISMLLGTGPNAFFMALALPVAQSALSLAMGTLQGRSNDNPRSKPRTKKRPFARAASNVGKGKEQNSQTDKGRGDTWSWTAANEVSFKKGNKSTPSFGGWDELDKQGRIDEVPIMSPEPRQQKKGKLSRRVRNREKPLLLRLLVAIFPFLESWTKLL